MIEPSDYTLLDFGDGRKLEKFGEYILDRPAPAAERSRRAHTEAWKRAHARFERDAGQQGSWRLLRRQPIEWKARHGGCTFELKLNEFGHVGLFPEQAENWVWLAKQIAMSKRPLKVLNLFAYTGGSTLAAARAGAQVTHVDAAKNVVAWARRNAELSSLAAAPIRWIVGDARTFVARELRRGNLYDAVILDPPSYGHGDKGQAWKLAKHLLPLLSDCAELTARQPAFMLLTCHTPGYGPAELEALVAEAVFGTCRAGARAKPLSITAEDGRKLPSGVVARWPR